MLEAHIERALPFDEIPLAAQRPDAVAVLLMLVRHGEAARHALPAYPSVSACSLAERAWPASLAWSELGLRGAEPQTLEALVRAELERAESRGAEMGERMRDELVGFVSNLLGITPEQLEELGSEEGARVWARTFRRSRSRSSVRCSSSSSRAARAAGSAAARTALFSRN